MFGSDEEQIAVYLPPSYDGSDRRYPVLYIMPGMSDFFIGTAEENSESLNWKMNGGAPPSRRQMVALGRQGCRRSQGFIR